MLTSEKSVKIKMVLLKTIVAFIQKNFIHDREFVQFLIRNCCVLHKFNSEHGTLEEYTDFVEACNNTMFILSSTIGTVDDLLKVELLQCLMKLEYTGICSTIAKCLSNLFGKSPEIHIHHPASDENGSVEKDEDEAIKMQLPTSEAIFVRCLILIGNYEDRQRIGNILSFLKNYCPNLYKQLVPLWNEKIPELINVLNTDHSTENNFNTEFFDLLLLTIKDVDDTKFSEALVYNMTDQIPLYSPLSHSQYQQIEFKVPNMESEKGMMVKLMGICLCYVGSEHMIKEKIDLIMNMARNEKMDKHAPHEDYEKVMKDYSKALGFVSCQHLDLLMKKLIVFITDDSGVKKSGSFFSHLHFMKDSHKENENYKMKILTLQVSNSKNGSVY
jgi:hypothetical protein